MKKVRCDFCGYNKHKGSLQEHHIDGNHFNNKKSNKQILCANCHIELHHKNKVLRHRYSKSTYFKHKKKTIIIKWCYNKSRTIKTRIFQVKEKHKMNRYVEYKNAQNNEHSFWIINPRRKLSLKEWKKVAFYSILY